MNFLVASSLAILLCLFQGTPSRNPPQTPAQAKTKATAKDKAKVVPKKTDHDSVETLVSALYDVISGPRGQKRDWKRFASLFLEGAKLNALVMGRDGKRRFFRMSPEEYVERSGKWAERNGLFEKETHRRVDLYGHIAQVFSTYELRVGRTTKRKPDLTGINSIQCSQVGGKWRILSLLWEDRRSAGPIPGRYAGRVRQGPPDEDSAELIRAMEEWEMGERAMQEWDTAKEAEEQAEKKGVEKGVEKGANDRK